MLDLRTLLESRLARDLPLGRRGRRRGDSISRLARDGDRWRWLLRWLRRWRANRRAIFVVAENHARRLHRAQSSRPRPFLRPGFYRDELRAARVLDQRSAESGCELRAPDRRSRAREDSHGAGWRDRAG